ncbi:MAG: hypothetical protein MK226_22710 [Saprospiraceae bacterium]|nr:hypothetical protein [Saprospiraceae bacterium]
MKRTLFVLVIVALSSSVYGQIKQLDEKRLDSLRAELENIFTKDQTFRRIYVQAEEVLGKDSYEIEYFWEVVEAQDKILEKQVAGIIDRYGWLGISQVGRRANTALWAVLQHGTLASKKKYAPLLKESVLNSESQPQHYARLIDRMLINNGEPQLYGTQIDYEPAENPIFFSIKEPEFINQRRAEIGLPDIQQFAKQRGIEWNVPQKKR